MCLRACSLLYQYYFDVLSPVNIEVLICLFAAACQNRMQVVIQKKKKKRKTLRTPIEPSLSGGQQQGIFCATIIFLAATQPVTFKLQRVLLGMLHTEGHKMIKFAALKTLHSQRSYKQLRFVFLKNLKKFFCRKNFLPAAECFKGQPQHSEPPAAKSASRLDHRISSQLPVVHLSPTKEQIVKLG